MQDVQSGVIFLYTSSNTSAYRREVPILGMIGSNYAVQTSNWVLVYIV